MKSLNPVVNCLDTMRLLSRSYYKHMSKSSRQIIDEHKRELAIRLLKDDDVDCYEMFFLNSKKNKNMISILQSYFDQEINSTEALDHIFNMIVNYHDKNIEEFFNDFDAHQQIFSNGDEE